MPARVRPHASVRLYDAGQGDVYRTDRGMAWLDILEQSVGWGSVSRDSSGTPLLEWLPEIGLTCRPFISYQDTRLAHWLASGGTWEERRIPWSRDRKYRLVQTDTSAGLAWSITSVYSLPANPHLAFSLATGDTPVDWDSAAAAPYVRAEFGGGEWGVQLSKGAAYLLRRVDGAFQVAAELPIPATGGYEDGGELLIILRCLRGQIGVSTDFGRSYTWYADPAGASLSIVSSTMTLRGQGGLCVFGLHQARYYAGVFTSSKRRTFKSRILPTVTITGRTLQPSGTAVAWTDVGDHPNQIAQYRATLTPTSYTTTGLVFYTAPEVYSTTYRIGMSTAGGAGTYTTPWDTRLRGISIRRAPELDQSTCTIRIQLDAGSTLSTNLRGRKVVVRLGWRLDDASDEMYTRYTGYVVDAEAAWDEYGAGTLTLTLDNGAAPLRGEQWEPLDVLPLGGQTVNAAGDYILGTLGWTASYRSWHAAGGLVTLDAGSPEDPCETLRPEETKFETLTRVMGYAGLEVAVRDDGVLLSGAPDYVSGVTHTKRANIGTLADQVWSVRRRIRTQDSATSVLVTGTSPYGEPLIAGAEDTTAETDPTSARFAPWRVSVQDQAPDTVTLGMLLSRAQGLAAEHLRLKDEVDALLYVDFVPVRRDRMLLYGCAEVGIPDATAHAILTLDDEWTLSEAGEPTLETLAGLRRI